MLQDQYPRHHLCIWSFSEAIKGILAQIPVMIATLPVRSGMSESEILREVILAYVFGGNQTGLYSLRTQLSSKVLGGRMIRRRIFEDSI